MLLRSDRYWAELCELIGHPELVDDDRFADAARRYQNREECVAALDEIFAAAPLGSCGGSGWRGSPGCGRWC